MPESPEVRARYANKQRTRRETAGPGGVDEGIFTTRRENMAVAAGNRANLAANLASLGRIGAGNTPVAGSRNVTREEYRAMRGLNRNYAEATETARDRFNEARSRRGQ